MGGKKRLLFFDLIRIIAILLIVMIHVNSQTNHYTFMTLTWSFLTSIISIQEVSA